jgi:glycerol-3-phosphate acyltransferase PlsY
LADYFISILLGYFIGSFPSAFLLVKLTAKKDIRKEGTGVTGTFNTFEVTQSKVVGISVLVLDLIKGVAAVLIVNFLFGNQFSTAAVSACSAIIGHNYPVWLKFKGGRGLAVTAGVMLVLGWIYIVAWIVLFGISYLSYKKLHLSNIVATVLSPVVLIFTPEKYLKYILPAYIDKTSFLYLAICVCLLLLISHIDQIKLLFQKEK